MKWQFNDNSTLEIEHLEGILLNCEIRLFCGANLPTMELGIQYSDDYQHLILGDEIKGRISTMTSNYDINGYVYEVKMGAIVNYKILLRPKDYFTKPITELFDSIKSALESTEKLDTKDLKDVSNNKVHGFMDFGCNLVDRLCAGYSKGIYARSYDRLIIRNPESNDYDMVPSIEDTMANGVINQYYNKYDDTSIYSEDLGDVDNMVALYGNNSSVQCMEGYKQFYENIMYNKKYNNGSTVSFSCSTWLGFEPGLIIDTEFINTLNDPDMPKKMFVRDVIVSITNSKVDMKVVLME